MTEPWRIVVPSPGGPEVMIREGFDPPVPGAREILVRNAAVGVNFLDTYHRSGLYPRPYPSGLGNESAGTIVAVGPDVDGFAVGDRVACLADGAYATHVLARADRSFRLPDDLSTETAAAVLLKGLTAWMLAEGVRPVTPGMRVLVLAAAGGVGSLLVPWIRALGGIVIAHAGTKDKAARAAAAGAPFALSSDWNDLARDVRDCTDGHGADLILDGVGKDSWAASLASVARRGLIATYGNASGPVPPFAPLELARAGSVFVTRPTLFDWIAEPAMRDTAWARLCGLIADGTVAPVIGQHYPLADVAAAHIALESRQTVGATVLLP